MERFICLPCSYYYPHHYHRTPPTPEVTKSVKWWDLLFKSSCETPSSKNIWVNHNQTKERETDWDKVKVENGVFDWTHDERGNNWSAIWWVCTLTRKKITFLHIRHIFGWHNGTNLERNRIQVIIMKGRLTLSLIPFSDLPPTQFPVSPFLLGSNSPTYFWARLMKNEEGYYYYSYLTFSRLSV